MYAMNSRSFVSMAHSFDAPLAFSFMNSVSRGIGSPGNHHAGPIGHFFSIVTALEMLLSCFFAHDIYRAIVQAFIFPTNEVCVCRSPLRPLKWRLRYFM